MASRAVALLALCGLLSACGDGGQTYSGTLRTEAVEVGSTIGGRVRVVRVTAGDRVHAGQILVQLEDSSERAEVAQAQGKLAQMRAQLADLLAGPKASEIAQARAQRLQAAAVYQKVARMQRPALSAARNALRDAQAALVLAQRTYVREASLGRTGDVSRQSVDQAKASFQSAQARVRMAHAQLVQVQRAEAPFDPRAAAYAAQAAAAAETTVRTGPRPEQIAQARAGVSVSQAVLAAARTTLGETIVRTPVDGTVESFDLHPGDLLTPDATAAVIDSRKDPYVRIYVPQHDLGVFVLGRTFRVFSDALPGRAFDGVVEERDRAAQFTPQNVETAADRAELTFGVKIRVHDPKHELYGGTTVTVDAP